MSADSQWRIGDRVSVRLPNHLGVHRGRLCHVEGTVTAVDLPNIPPGVQVTFDSPFNGVDTCYAAHDELQRHP